MSKLGNSSAASLAARFMTRSLALAVISFYLAGCTQLGPGLVRAGRNDYNIILQQTEDEELILNLVRVRYGDRPLFLDVNNVSTSFTWTQGTSAQGKLFESGGKDLEVNNVGIGGNLQYTERPTITYTPLGGKDFVKSVLTPADLDTLVMLSNAGWSIDRLLRIMANRLNGLPNAPRASGPTPDDAPVYQEFRRATKLMRKLQVKGVLRLGYQQIKGVKIPVLIIDRTALDWDDTRKLKKLLGLATERNTFMLDIRGNLPRADSIGIELRSLLSAFFFVSHGVNIPTRDAESGRAMITRDKDGQSFDWSLVVGDLVSIRSSADKPDNARIAVKYRGSWFYIDDSDLNTKYTLVLVEQLAALLGGKVEKAGPVLTLPVSGP